MIAKYAKPTSQHCGGCQLETKGTGYVPSAGPLTSNLFFLGEAAGITEALRGEPFVGAAGSMLARIFRRASLDRDAVLIDNTVRCEPPGDWLDGAPWEHAALQQCRYWQETTETWLASPSQHAKVMVTLGSTALKQALELQGYAGIKVQDFHGTVHRDPSNRFWVVPTYHPSYLQRGAINLLDVVRHDLSVAQEVSRGTWQPQPIDLIVDPTVAWWDRYVDDYCAAAAQDPDGVWMGVDCETPDKAGGRDEGELTNDDRSYTMTRTNFSCHPDQGVTVPHMGPFMPGIRRIMASQGVKLFWHLDYDRPRFLANGYAMNGRIWDLMWAWHILQSDLPRGLGFVSPFYSKFGAWKHWSKMPGQEGPYAAADGPQTLRNGYGIVGDLVAANMWSVFERHVEDLDRFALKPAEAVGLAIDSVALDAFQVTLETKATEKLGQIKERAASVTSLKPKAGYTKKPTGPPSASILGQKKGKAATVKTTYLAEHVKLIEKVVSVQARYCASCGTSPATVKHRCRNKAFTANVVVGPVDQLRYFWQLPFNPDAPAQVLKYITDSGHKPGQAKKTRKPTTNAETLRKLWRSTGDPVYRDLLDYRGIGKVLGTYVLGVRRRLGEDGRIHTTFTHKPSTFRLSSLNPNVTNVITDRGGPESLAAGFRRCIVASEGCRLLEVDYAGIEAVETGWYLDDKDYTRLASLGVHAYLCSHLIGRPADLSWSDADLAAYFSEIKKTEKQNYDKSKRCVHGNNYGLTVFGMHNNFPEVFPSLKEAQKVQDLYYSISPKLKGFHRHVREKAHKQGYLGGPGDHPFGYRHWFWGVLAYKPITDAQRIRLDKIGGNYTFIGGRPFKIDYGEDSKRVIAFYPQSTAAGVIKDAMLRLFDPDSPYYVGDAYYGQTPLRAPVHDSLLLDIPHRRWDDTVEKVLGAMRQPILSQPLPWDRSQHLRIGVEAKEGLNWLDMNKFEIPDAAAETAAELMYSPVEEDEADDDFDLGVQMTPASL